MNFTELLPVAGISFVFLSLLFIPMEKAFPAKAGQKIFRRQWKLDLCFFFGQYLLWNSLVLLALSYLSHYVNGVMPAALRHSIQQQPFLLQAAEVILLSDLLIYWGHRLQHKVGFLWRFHKVHHSAPHLDWLAAHREHPLDSIYTIGLINLPALIMGFDLNAIAALIAFRGLWAIYIHSNVRLNIGPLKYVIGSPELHHWHHSLDRDAGNYANISPLMDLIFRTHYCPRHEPEAFGIKEAFPEHYAGQLLHPLLPKKVLQRLKQKRYKVMYVVRSVFLGLF
jgi:sterol desaturase/sphingolipid hydroxylase (fatty acid hydroxylase superfamily)